MSQRTDTIVGAFRAIRPSFERATEELFKRVTDVIVGAQVPHFEIQRRTKEPDSLDGKLQSKKCESYCELADVTDLSGVCVVVFFEDDIKPLIELLESSFTGVTKDDLVDKLSISDTDRFGYRAHHLTVSLSENLAALDGSDAEALAGYKGEIQIRTGFMHVWAKIEHGYNYKAESASVEVRRGFARLASLVELSDQELTSIHKWFIQNQASIVTVNSVSAMISSQENQNILRILTKENHATKTLGSTEIEIEQTQTLLRGAGFSDIRVIKEQLLSRQHQVVKAMSKYFPQTTEIRPQNPMDFLAFDEVIQKRQIAGLVELIQLTVKFDDDIQLFDHCRRIYTACTNL